jgi:hypothetical protein
MFILSPGNAAEKPLARSALGLSDANTLLTYSTLLPTNFDSADSSLGVLRTMLPAYAAFEGSLEKQGLKPNDFGKAFGPEFGMVLNWSDGAAQPSALFALDVRDAATAKKFVDALAEGGGSSPAWGREEKEGVTMYQSPPPQGLIPIAPSLVLTKRFLVVGFSPTEAVAGAGQLESGKAAIASTPAFAESSKAVGQPTAGFGYVDLKMLVDRAYGSLRPWIAMSLAFSPDSAQYVDAGHLPRTEAISKHLSPAVFSQSVTPDGTLIESVGPVTFNEVGLLVAGAAAGAAFPMIQNAVSSGIKLDPGLLQGSPLQQLAPKEEAPKPDAAPAPGEGIRQNIHIDEHFVPGHPASGPEKPAPAPAPAPQL